MSRVEQIYFIVDDEDPTKYITKHGNEQIKVGGGLLEYIEWAEVADGEERYPLQTQTIYFNGSVGLDVYRAKFIESARGQYHKPVGMQLFISLPWARKSPVIAQPQND